MGKPKPIELMHLYYGTNTEKTCGECCNIVEYRAGNKTIRKCRAYGVTCSCRSDFAKRWTACNLFGNEIDHQIISDSAKQIFSRCYNSVKQEKAECDGQIGILEV